MNRQLFNRSLGKPHFLREYAALLDPITEDSMDRLSLLADQYLSSMNYGPLYFNPVQPGLWSVTNEELAFISIKKPSFVSFQLHSYGTITYIHFNYNQSFSTNMPDEYTKGATSNEALLRLLLQQASYEFDGRVFSTYGTIY